MDVWRIDGYSELIDFGVAVMSGQGSRSGTPAYMAPEQWRGGRRHRRRTCTRPRASSSSASPGTGRSRAQVMSGHLNEPVPVAAVPEPVRPLVERGMAKDPARRQSDASGLMRELDGVAAAAYGADWEHRGIRTLAAVAGLSALFPLAMLGSMRPEAAPVQGADGLAVDACGQAVFHKAGTAKVGGAAKAVLAAGAVVTVAVAATGGVMVWQRADSTEGTTVRPSGAAPSPTLTTVGGTVTGDLTGTVTRPGRHKDLSKLKVAINMNVKPARVRAGTDIVLRTDSRFQQVAKNISYKMGGAGEGGAGLAFFPVPPNAPGRIPQGPGSWVKASDVDRDTKGSSTERGTVSVVTAKAKITVPVPPAGELKPGRYLVGPFNPVAFDWFKIEGERIAPSRIGARFTGRLPVVTVLPGPPARRTTESSTPGAPRSPSCVKRTIVQDDGDRVVRCD